MALARINAKIAALDWERVLETPRGHVVYVCDASEADWNELVEDESQKLKSTHMEWVDGKIYIVELPSLEHELYSRAFEYLFLYDNRIIDTYMVAYGQSYVDTGPRYEPDESFGPSQQVPGAVLPRPLRRWAHWHTLKVEMGFSRRWGHSPDQLDGKANKWTTFPGVRYVLCVAVEGELVSADYKLYTVEQEGQRLPDQDPIPIVAPQTVVTFDSRLLLGLQPDDALPDGFPDPLGVALYAVLERARARLVECGTQAVGTV